MGTVECPQTAAEKGPAMRHAKPVRLLVLLGLALCAVLLAAGCDSSTTIEIGTIRVDVTTVGNNLDPDGYVIRVTGNGEDQSKPVEVNGSVLFAVNAGRYEVELTDKADNCVSDLNPQVVNVSAGETTNLVFNNLCG